MITLEQLTTICSALNKGRVKYVVIGGWAIYAHGYERTTRDIDLLIDPSDKNIKNLKEALRDALPEACAELKPDDLEKNVVVRMVGADAIVDIMKSVGDIDYAKACADLNYEEIDGVRIPFAGLNTMLELKGGIRETDKRDYLFLLGKKSYLNKRS